MIPPVLDEERTEISIEMDIYSVTNIDELAMSFNAEVRINLQWTDPRHDYKHLKNNANFLGTYHILHYHVLDIFGPHSSTHLIRKCHHFPIPIYRPYMTTTNAHTKIDYMFLPSKFKSKSSKMIIIWVKNTSPISSSI